MLECSLGLNGSYPILCNVKVHIFEVGIMVDEDGSSNKSLQCWTAAVNGNKTLCGADQLINAHNMTRSGYHSNLLQIANAFMTPLSSVGFAISAARTC